MTNEQIVRDACKVVWSEGDVSRISEFYAEDFKTDYPDYPKTNWESGTEGIKNFVLGLKAGIPDYSERIDDLIDAGDRIIVRLSISGTHTGPLPNLPATGKPFKFREIAVCRVENGKIVEQCGLTDYLTFYTQLGLIELPKTPLSLYTGAPQHENFVSALIGIAIDEGLIRSIEDPITSYVPALAGSAYDGVRIKDVMQMSSGARWNEDYSDPDAEIHRYSAVMAGEEPFDEFMANTVRERESGTLCLYNSGDTQALGMLLVNATGRTITDYMQEKLCEPLGMESPGYWVLDCDNMEMAAGGVNLTARDFAKIGELFRNQGVWSGRQIVSEPWVAASIKPDAPHLMPGQVVGAVHSQSRPSVCY